MLAMQYRIAGDGCSTPLPISAVIQTANRFGCDIYIKGDAERINVKNYDELHSAVYPQGNRIKVYFDGADEKEADVGFRRLFGIRA